MTANDSEPHKVLVARFWREFGWLAIDRTKVFVSCELVQLETIRDAHEKIVDGFRDMTGEAVLFFVDMLPKANWAHRCAYVAVQPSGDSIFVSHRWPPSRSIDMTRMRRPDAL